MKIQVWNSKTRNWDTIVVTKSINIVLDGSDKNIQVQTQNDKGTEELYIRLDGVLVVEPRASNTIRVDVKD